MKILQGNVSDILRDYAQDKYLCYEMNGKYLFADDTNDENSIYELTEEIEYFLDIILNNN